MNLKNIKSKTEGLIPPDGGWGWVICFAFALNNFMIIPIKQSFGLIFKDKFVKIGLSATDAAVIFTTNSAFGMLLGIINGSFLKTFGFRKVSVVGGILTSLGIILTAFANTFETFFIFYGLITSLGFRLSMSSVSLALNSYFKEKRGRATGFAMTGMALGPIIFPLLVSVLLDFYGTTGCVLIIAAMTMHTLVAASLLQPLKWHAFKELHKTQEMIELGNDDNGQVAKALLSKADEVNNPLSTNKNNEHSDNEESEEKNETPKSQSILSAVVAFFDLDLLRDPKYLNLMLGMSLAICAEINFTLLIPFILTDFKFSTYETAQIMSTTAATDVVFRFCAPFIADYLNKPPKMMYAISLMLAILSRTGLILVSSYHGMMIIAAFLGMTRGLRTVFMSLLIPSYVPLPKLPSASGIQMFANGIVVLIAGPALGAIRDFTGSYDKCIIVINIITFVTIILWTIEYLCIYCKR